MQQAYYNMYSNKQWNYTYWLDKIISLLSYIHGL